MEILEFHEVANLFPLMDGKEYDELCQDIKDNGLLEQIWIHPDGSILDGRNRYRACLQVGIEPSYNYWQNYDQTELEFVLSKNLHRRHLNETQRAIIASKITNTSHGGNRKNQAENFPLEIRQSDAANMLNVSDRTIRTVRTVAKEAPELLQKMEAGKMSAHQAEKKVKEKKRTQERKEMAEKVEAIPFESRFNVFCGDIKTIELTERFDFIITDPPYPREYLSLYEVLARRAKEWLMPSGLLVAMCGQSYLDEIYAMMSEHLEYYWTACYLIPGPAVALRQKQVNTNWKPILIYGSSGYRGKIFGDVYKSEKPDKEHHEWGQSITGMLDLVKQICLPGQNILDPFCGAGTTGVAALLHGCTFTGFDIDMVHVNQSIQRMTEI